MTNFKIAFQHNLRFLMNTRGLTGVDIARIAGVSKQAVSAWLNGSKVPRMDKIERLANYFGIQKSELIEEKHTSIDSKSCDVPLIYGVAAGVPILAEDNIIEYMPVSVRNADECFALVVRGESMVNANIPDGCRIVVHMQHTAENGQIVVCRVNRTEATLKRFKRLASHVLLMPENPAFEPIIVPAEDFDNGDAEILGVVVQIIIDV